MTDAEKMLETMMMMGKAVSEEQQKQIDMAAETTKMFYDSYVNAGFTKAQAMELIKEMLRAIITSGVKK